MEINYFKHPETVKKIIKDSVLIERIIAGFTLMDESSIYKSFFPKVFDNYEGVGKAFDLCQIQNKFIFEKLVNIYLRCIDKEEKIEDVTEHIFITWNYEIRDLLKFNKEFK